MVGSRSARPTINPPSTVDAAMSASALDVDFGPWRIAFGDEQEAFVEAAPPGKKARGVQLPDLAVEDLVLVGEGRREAAGMRLGQVRHHLGEQLEPDEETMERVVVEFVATAEEVVEQLAVAFEVTEDQRLGEVRLVLEMVEEPALGDTGGDDQFLDRRRRESLREHRQLGEVE